MHFAALYLLAFVVQQSPEEQQANAFATKLANVYRSLEKQSTPGTAVQFETGKQPHSFRMRVSGISPGAVFTLLQTDGLRPQQILSGITMKDGLAVCAGKPDTCGDPAKPDDPIDLVMVASPGEPRILGLVSDDQQQRIFFKLIPDPVVVKDKQCRVEAVRLMPHGEVVYIVGNVAPGAKVGWESESHGEKRASTATADADGKFDFALLPFVKGKKRGTTKVRFTTDACKPSLSFDWGEDSNRPRT
jgi:hypothetical protein